MPRPLSARRESGQGDEDALRAHGVKTRGCADDRLAPKLPHPESWRRSRRELCGNAPAEQGRRLLDGKNLVFLYLWAPNSTQLARIRESCSAPRALRRRIGKKLGFLYLKRGFLHTGSCFSCHQAKKTAPQIQKRQILASRLTALQRAGYPKGYPQSGAMGRCIRNGAFEATRFRGGVTGRRTPGEAA